MSDPHRRALLALSRPDYFAARRHEKDLMALTIHHEDAHPSVRDFTLRVLNELHRYQVPLRCFNIYRGKAAQNEAFANGNSRARWGQSPHNFGLATDLIHATEGWGQGTPSTMPRVAWEAIHVIAAEVARRMDLPIKWGGHFHNLWDPAHFELTNWRDLTNWQAERVNDMDRVNRWANEVQSKPAP